MLALDDPRWGELRHAYGSATGVCHVPYLLRLLEADPNKVDYSGDVDDPWSLLYGSICHQGTAYSASYAAVPHLVRIASLAADPLPTGYLLLPAHIERGRVHYALPAPMPSDLEEGYLQAVAKLPELIPRMVKADLDQRSALAISEAVLILCSHWEIGEGVSRMDLTEVKLYWEFRPIFQYLQGVTTWKDFPNEEIFRFMSDPGDTRFMSTLVIDDEDND